MRMKNNYKKEKREESLKIAVSRDYFSKYIYKQLGNIDFVIAKHNVKNGQSYLSDEYEEGNLRSILWAEAKLGTSHNIYESFVQLILTIGKEKTFEKNLPPKYIGAFDAEKFAFIEYHKIQDIFYQNDFNWNVTPSNHESKEFKQIYNMCKNLLEDNSYLFFYDKGEKDLKEFISLNFKTDSEITEKISVTRNNFTFVFQRWLEKVKPTIDVDWVEANKENIISADFFLADLISDNNESIKDNLNVVLKQKEYYYNKERKRIGGFTFDTVGFTDRQKAHKEFWNLYNRPPKEEYWEYMILRRDLLVPQDIREIKGSYFTPKIWVEKSQEYITDVLGENWQDEYYIWDCCAGTGNLLNGLVNKHNIWASTLDKADVEIMKDMVSNGWNMFENHIFQFDFLNDDFSKCPDELQEILNDEEKRKKLVIYINPPYAEAGNIKQLSGTGENKTDVAVTTKSYEKYLDKIGIAGRELYAQFFIRVYEEINGCILAEFSKLKILQAPNFKEFRNVFNAKLEKLFVVPAKTFDNVKGNFPIGFFIWNTKNCHTDLESTNVASLNNSSETALAVSNPCDNFTIAADAYDENGDFLQKKIFSPTDDETGNIGKWVSTFKDEKGFHIGFMSNGRNDFQNQSLVYFMNERSQMPTPRGWWITPKNLIVMMIFVAVRQCISQTWLNDRDQFLYPNDGWKTDKEFQSNCLIYTLFHGQNRISSEQGVNNWIPFTESQVGCKKSFKSHFMSDFLQGKIKLETEGDMFAEKKSEYVKIELSPAAQSVYDAGLELWKYYHSQTRSNPDASFYDIREYFQGKTNGKMNAKSDDEKYTELISDLRDKMKLLSKQIEPKVYEYGFLKA
ncbi:MAG: hypothetical protein VZR56_04930 [Treponema sp.]|nr:hypothetical protein [Treponema sp.]